MGRPLEQIADISSPVNHNVAICPPQQHYAATGRPKKQNAATGRPLKQNIVFVADGRPHAGPLAVADSRDQADRVEQIKTKINATERESLVLSMQQAMYLLAVLCAVYYVHPLVSQGVCQDFGGVLQEFGTAKERNGLCLVGMPIMHEFHHEDECQVQGGRQKDESADRESR